MTSEEPRAWRATIVNEAWTAHKAFAMVIHARRTTPGGDEHVVQLTVDEAIEKIRASFKHFLLEVQARPIIVSTHRAAMEYRVIANDFDEPIEVGVFYLIPSKGGVYVDAAGNGASLGFHSNVRTVDEIGGWLSDCIVDVGLLSARGQKRSGIFT
jgi:hypothetical protein